MNKYLRGTLFFLVLAGLGTEFYFAGRVLKRRFNIETAFAKAVVESQKAIKAEVDARTALTTAKSELVSAKLGWGYEWEFPAGGNIGSVSVVRGTSLNVNGLGKSNGLVPVTKPGTTDQFPPIAHVFTLNDQNQVVYIGEFAARLDQLQDTNCILEPTWVPEPLEMAGWDFSRGARIRSQIPPGPRNSFSGLNQTILRSFQQASLTDIHIEDQKRLNAAAEEGLNVRKRELTGDPNGPEIAEHSEYRLGLVTALKNQEEERNAVQAEVDNLRRRLKTATELRQSQMEDVRRKAGAGSPPSARLSQRPE